MANERFEILPMKQTQKPKRTFLYSGLGVLLVAFAAKWAGMAAYCFWTGLGIAVALKTLFLISVLRARKFRLGLWFCLILTGVGLILISLPFKTVFPVPLLHKVLFYGAVLFKVSGLILMLCSKGK
jgi:hypothetical protein